MPFRAAWIAAQKRMFRLESYNSGIGAGVDGKDASQTIVDHIFNSDQAQAEESKGPPRPPNAWILYRTAKLTEFKAQSPSGNIQLKDLHSTSSDSAQDDLSPPLVRSRNTCLQAQLSRLISNMWKMEAAEVKAEYYTKAEERKRLHSKTFPDYKYRPKKKKSAHHLHKDGEATSSSSALSPTQLSPPMHAMAAKRRKKLSKAKSLYSIRSKLVNSRADDQHRHRSASPYPTPLLSPALDTLEHSYDSSPRSLVHSLLPSTPLAEADAMQRRTLMRHSCGEEMLPTYMTANVVNMQAQQHEHLLQRQRLHESTNRPGYFPHNPSFDAATESSEEALLSPTLVITPPASSSVFAATANSHYHSASLATPQKGIVPWSVGQLYQTNAAVIDSSQQQWTHATPPQSGSPHYYTTSDGAMHPFYQHMPAAGPTDYFPTAEVKSTQESIVGINNPASSSSSNNNNNDNNNVNEFSNTNSTHSTTRTYSDGAVSPNSLRFTSSIMARRVQTDVQCVPMPLAMPMYAVGGAAGPAFAGGAPSSSPYTVPTPAVLGYTSHAMQYSSSSPVRAPLLSPGFATNALQLQFADLQMQHQSPQQAHPSLMPRS